MQPVQAEVWRNEGIKMHNIKIDEELRKNESRRKV